MYQEVIEFWFEEVESSRWWQKDPEFDQLVYSRFKDTHLRAVRGELYQWRSNALGRLAEIIVLDQFSRNMFRDTASAFAFDSLALILAQEAVSLGEDMILEPEKRSFLYMPYMHSESLLVHESSLHLFRERTQGNTYEFELKHYDIIKKFGRYPHRNEILNRQSTEEELQFLTQPGSSF